MKKQFEKTGAILLAAGMSTRMNAFKPLLPFAGTTIAGYMVKLLKELQLDPIFVVTGYKADQLESHLSDKDIRFIRNERYRETEMFDSVKLGLSAAQEKCDRVLLLPIDIPGIKKETIIKSMETDALISRTVCNGKPGHPVSIDKSAIPKICVYHGDRGLKGAIEESGVPIVEIEVEDEGIYLDADTPEEYKKLIEGK